MRHLELAKKIVKQLVDAGFTAYFAGGWVRDYVMDHPSHDVDIATDASPEKIMTLFPKTLLVGIQFGVVIVVMEGHQFEVSTFRSDISYSDGRRPDRIVLASPQEDALRRDFTINGMFFDPLQKEIHDFVGGKDDIQKKVIRTIGVPSERFQEDRLRMIRAIRFACRFSFDIDLSTQQAIQANAKTLFPAVAKERVWQELQKMQKTKRLDDALCEMHRLGLLSVIFPALEQVSMEEMHRRVSSFSLFPDEVPTILFLLFLFPHADQKECIDIAKNLRMPKREQKWIEAFFETQKMVAKETVSQQEWTRFYAHPFHFLCLEVIAARYEEEKRVHFLQHHRKQKEKLHNHIQRVLQQNPLITARDLRELGVRPGISMGKLLEVAEKIAIEENCSEKGDVFPSLFETSEWRTADREESA